MKAHQYRSLFLTLLIHAGLFIMLMFLYITSQNPPWEEGLAGGGGGGSFVEFGTLEFNDAPQVTPQTQETTINKDDEIITSDIEETVAINQPDKKKDPKPDKKKDIKPSTKPVIKEPVLAKVEERKADPRSLYPGKKGSSGSPTGTQPGNGTGGTGNGNGGGNGDGTGTGSGGGTGTGSGGGNGDGAGIGFDLTGRNFRSLRT